MGKLCLFPVDKAPFQDRLNPVGQTIIEKILSKAADRDAAVGERVWAKLDLVAMRDFGGPNVIQEYRENFRNKKVFDGRKVAITFDLHVPARDEKVAQNQKLCRDFAQEQKTHLFDVNTGIGQHILFEHGMVKPWDVVIGTDSHMNLLGVFGAFATGVGTTDIVAGMAYGKLWFRVPETIKIAVTGRLRGSTCAKDVILHILKQIRADGAIYKAIEFTGPTVDSLDLAGRITVASMVTEMSGKIGFTVPSPGIYQFIKRRTGKRTKPVAPDPDARYEKVIEFDVSRLAPQIACPHSPDNVKNVSEVEGTKIDQVFIGSCTNGRIEDLRAAARILRRRKVKVRTIIVPATMEVAQAALRTGLYEIFLKAGCVVTNPSCALCTTGHPGILAPGEVMVSTSNRNFVGKLGKGAEVYLASPATAAFSAVSGHITTPQL